ncbi:hypothetical protein B0T21DRAFT_416854 [Apiosordaria backusii]|uniref:Uncharacterized protein n=1 Tax=Apiosordaria backusii TaxID=314023 RepID=A0AA39ZS33_9PEZI|nr:hypothetical protein B0T21DRAFT_416854 [Apiosordaria backusii]
MFNAFQSALQSMGEALQPDLDYLNDSDQDSTYASDSQRSSGEQKPESDTDSNHEEQENDAPVTAQGSDDENANDAAPANPKPEGTATASPATPQAANHSDSPSDYSEDESKNSSPKQPTNQALEQPQNDESGDENDDINSIDLSLLQSPTPSKIEKRAARAAQFGGQLVNNSEDVTGPTGSVNDDGDSFDRTLLQSPTPSETERRAARAARFGPARSENGDLDSFDLSLLNSPTPSEIERRAARAARFGVQPDGDDNGSPTTRVSASPTVTPQASSGYYRPTKEQLLARAELVENTPADELYFGHPNPFYLRNPDLLAWPTDPDMSDYEKNVQRTIKTLEWYHDLPENETIPKWMEDLVRQITNWACPDQNNDAETVARGDSSTYNSSSTGSVKSGQFGAEYFEQPGAFYWESPSDVRWALLKRGVKGRPRVETQTSETAANPTVTPQKPEQTPQEPEQTPQEQPTHSSPPTTNQRTAEPLRPSETGSPSTQPNERGSPSTRTNETGPPPKRKANSPKESPSKRGRTDEAGSSSRSGGVGQFDGGADTPDGARRIRRRKSSTPAVVRPRRVPTASATTINPGHVQRQKQQSGGFTWWDFIMLVLLLFSLAYAYNYNNLIVAGYGGHMNGGHFGWHTLLTFVGWFHILCVMAPCFYFGARFSGGISD